MLVYSATHEIQIIIKFEDYVYRDIGYLLSFVYFFGLVVCQCYGKQSTVNKSLDGSMYPG